MSSAEVRPAILIFGAGGRLGRTLVAEALNYEHRVRAVIHHSNPLRVQPGLEIIRADIRDPDTLIGLFDGIDVVMSSLGSAGSSPCDVAGTGAEAIIALMAGHEIRRLVSVTGTGAALPGERPDSWHATKRNQMLVGAPHLLADGDHHLKVLASGDLDWTALRVPFMTHEADTGYQLTASAPHPVSSLPFRAAATAMLDLIESTAWVRSAPFASAAVRPVKPLAG